MKIKHEKLIFFIYIYFMYGILIYHTFSFFLDVIIFVHILVYFVIYF